VFIFVFWGKSSQKNGQRIINWQLPTRTGYYLEKMEPTQDKPAFDPNKFYTAKEAAELLPYSYKTVLTWIKERKVEASRPKGTRKFLVKGQAILDYYDSGKLEHSSSSSGSDWLDPDAIDAASEYLDLSDAELEELAISGKVLNRIFFFSEPLTIFEGVDSVTSSANDNPDTTAEEAGQSLEAGDDYLDPEPLHQVLRKRT
jgi:excisionase family DNA binding protein